MLRFIFLLCIGSPLFAAGGDVIEFTPKKSEFKIEELQALVDAGKYKTALKKGIKFANEKKSAKAYNLVGYSYRQLKKYKKAVKAYRLALKYDPKLSIAKEYLGVAYLRLKKVKAAKRLHAQLKKENPRLAKMLRMEAKKLGVAL